MTKTYGVISDLHEISVQAFPLAIKILKEEKIDALVLNGGIFGERSGYHPQEYLSVILDVAGKSGWKLMFFPEAMKKSIFLSRSYPILSENMAIS